MKTRMKIIENSTDAMHDLFFVLNSGFEMNEEQLAGLKILQASMEINMTKIDNLLKEYGVE